MNNIQMVLAWNVDEWLITIYKTDLAFPSKNLCDNFTSALSRNDKAYSPWIQYLQG